MLSNFFINSSIGSRSNTIVLGFTPDGTRLICLDSKAIKIILLKLSLSSLEITTNQTLNWNLHLIPSTSVISETLATIKTVLYSEVFLSIVCTIQNYINNIAESANVMIHYRNIEIMSKIDTVSMNLSSVYQLSMNQTLIILNGLFYLEFYHITEFEDISSFERFDDEPLTLKNVVVLPPEILIWNGKPVLSKKDSGLMHRSVEVRQNVMNGTVLVDYLSKTYIPTSVVLSYEIVNLGSLDNKGNIIIVISILSNNLSGISPKYYSKAFLMLINPFVTRSVIIRVCDLFEFHGKLSRLKRHRTESNFSLCNEVEIKDLLLWYVNITKTYCSSVSKYYHQIKYHNDRQCIISNIEMFKTYFGNSLKQIAHPFLPIVICHDDQDY